MSGCSHVCISIYTVIAISVTSDRERFGWATDITSFMSIYATVADPTPSKKKTNKKQARDVRSESR